MPTAVANIRKGDIFNFYSKSIYTTIANSNSGNDRLAFMFCGTGAQIGIKGNGSIEYTVVKMGNEQLTVFEEEMKNFDSLYDKYILVEFDFFGYGFNAVEEKTITCNTTDIQYVGPIDLEYGIYAIIYANGGGVSATPIGVYTLPKIYY